VERAADPAALRRAQDEHAQAHARRGEAARAFLATRAPADREAYLAAGREVARAREGAVRLAESAAGARYSDTNYIFPTYILTHLPRGLAGLVIAVIFAAAMSTLSGEFNSLATATMVDFYKRYVRADGGARHDLLVSRLLTGFWGLFASAVALQSGRFGSAIETVNRFGSYVYGPILGVFALAVLTPWVRGSAAFWAVVVGEAVVAAVVLTSPVHFLWYTLIGTLTVVAGGVVLQAARPRS
jgi:Na+/proline symporter